MAEPKTWLIVNPNAGRKAGISTNAAGPDEALQTLRRHGIEAELHLTERKDHATEIARQAVEEGVEVVVAAGGDGTVHEVACGLIGSQTTLGIYPLGSMMNLARALEVPRDLDLAAEVIRAGRTTRMDVGLATTNTASAYFLEAAGVGFDAGLFAYWNQLDAGNWKALRPMLRFVARYSRRPLRVTVDGRSKAVPAFMITVAISPYMGAAMTVAPNAKVDDGKLDVVIRDAYGRVDLLRHIVAMARGKDSYSPRTISLQARQVQVQHGRRSLMVHADSQSLGTTPVRFELVPAAFSVLVGETPAGQPSAIVTSTPAASAAG